METDDLWGKSFTFNESLFKNDLKNNSRGDLTSLTLLQTQANVNTSVNAKGEPVGVMDVTLTKAWAILTQSSLYLPGIRFQQKYVETKAFKDFGVKLIETHRPGCEHFTYDSDNYWRCVIRAESVTMFHPTSTCKMGRKDDNTTVVDSQLR